MAFGLFKKTQQADIIFYHGHIYTHDPDFPWAEAVACLDGKILAVGDFDAMDSIKGSDTEIFDLQDKYVLPGLIDVHRSPVLRIFDGKYLCLSDCSDSDEVCGKLTDWADSHPNDEILFGYGYKEDCEPEQEDLDQCCQDRPVVLLAESGVGCCINSAAEAIVTETAEEECVEVITASYILNLLIPFDFTSIEEEVNEEIETLCDKGITSVLNLQTPDYLESLYQDSLLGLYNEGLIKQRFFGAYLLNRPLIPKGLVHRLMARKTNCSEMGELIHAEMLNIYLDQESCPMEFSQEALEEILLAACDKGFPMFIEAIQYEDLKKAYYALETLRNKGYKNTITIASDCDLQDADLSLLEKSDTVLTTWGTNVFASHPVAADVKTVADAIDELTVKAAAIIGTEDKLGTIEKGKLADLAIFD